MSNYFPYVVLHIQLDQPLIEELFPATQESGYYAVFWWKQIPLAHLYIEQNHPLKGTALLSSIADLIEPVIETYIQSSGRNVSGYSSAFREGAFQEFSDQMDYIFSHYSPSAYPKKVAISIIICTRNRSAHLEHCLSSLQNLVSAPHEIIVIDNAPMEDSTKRIAEKYPDVSYYVESRAGLDIARNTGAQMATSSIIAYIDDDVLVNPLLTYEIWQTFSNKGIAAMTGLIIASSLDTASQQIFEKNWGFNRGYRDKTFSESFIRKNDLNQSPAIWEIGAGANMAFRKSVLDEVGYFDERLDVGAAGCSGDSELWFRMLSRGYRIQYNPRAVVYHEHRKDLKAFQKQIFNYMRGHAVAALIQHTQYEAAGYRRRVLFELPAKYLRILMTGFPHYYSKYQTLFTEIRGMMSGIMFYLKHRKSPSNIYPTTKSMVHGRAFKDA